jgi:hypothetical protein
MAADPAADQHLLIEEPAARQATAPSQRERVGVTILRLPDGQSVGVHISLSEARELLQQAMADGVLLHFQPPDADAVVVNPSLVHIVEDVPERGPL